MTGGPVTRRRQARDNVWSESAAARAGSLTTLLIVTLAACGDDPTSGAPIDGPIDGPCPDAQLACDLGDGRRETWCATDGIADGVYTLHDGDWLVREGRFARGQPTGAWADWHPRAALAEGAAPAVAMRYAFVDGLAHGTFEAWSPAGARLWERSWVAGAPCGAWRDFDARGEVVKEVDYPACDGSTPNVSVPDELGLVSPRVTDFGWDGATCPDGSERVVDHDPEADVIAAGSVYCRRDGVASGPFRRVSNGRVVMIGAYSEGARAGRWISFHPPDAPDLEAEEVGQRIAENGTYEGGVRAGRWSTFRADGTLERRGEYVADEPDGVWEGYAPSLLRAWVGEYDAGDRVGVWRTYHADVPRYAGSSFAVAGGIASEETWVGGVRHGPFTHWFASGAKERAGAFVAGAWSGVVTTWWEGGARRFETTYVGGMATGMHRQWDERGLPEAEGRYVFGVADGAWTTWADPNPILLFFGGPVARTRLTATWIDGRLEGDSEGRYELGGEVAGLASEAHFEGGVDEGDAIFYWPDGKTLAEGWYEGGAAQGPWQSYYASGAARATWPFARGILHGPFVERFESGSTRREGRYGYDRRVGTWTTWDEAGAVVLVEECGVGGEGCDCALTTEGCR